MAYVHTGYRVGKRSAKGTRRIGQRSWRKGKKHHVEGSGRASSPCGQLAGEERKTRSIDRPKAEPSLLLQE